MRATSLVPVLVVCLAACAATDESSDPAGASNVGANPPATQKPKPPDTGPPDPGPAATGEPWLDETNRCTGTPGSFYALKVRQLAAITEIPLCRLQGYVLLVVNGASHCSQTYQYKPLQQLYAKYKDQKFVVLAFPSNTFDQEYDPEAKVSSTCTDEYGVRFPLFTIAPVNDKAATSTAAAQVAQPVYQWLKAQPTPPKTRSMADLIPWNFEKFIIARDGTAVKRFDYKTNPDPAVPTPVGTEEGADGTSNVVDAAIQAELAK